MRLLWLDVSCFGAIDTHRKNQIKNVQQQENRKNRHTFSSRYITMNALCTKSTLCCRIALVLRCLHLEKMEKQCKKMELENANLKEAHMTIAEKMGKQNASLKKCKKIKWRKNRKNKCNLERGTFDKWRIHGKNQCKLEGGDIICGEYRPMKCN